VVRLHANYQEEIDNPVRNLISNGASRALFTPLNLSEAKALTGVGGGGGPALQARLLQVPLIHLKPTWGFHPQVDSDRIKTYGEQEIIFKSVKHQVFDTST